MRLHIRRFGFRQLRSVATSALLVAIGIFLVGNSIMYGADDTDDKRLVTVYDRGNKQVILTNAKSVKDALQSAGVPVLPGDIIEPELTTALTSTDSVVNIYRARSVIVVDGAIKQKILTAGKTAEEIVSATDLEPVRAVDKTNLIVSQNLVSDGASAILTIERALPLPPKSEPVTGPSPNALTKSKGAHIFVDSKGVAHRETYYDLLMNIVIGHCGGSPYTVRSDGAKVDKDGYILVAANYNIYPRCSVVETSMGLGKVYDTGGFAIRHPYGFDLATDWTNYDGR